MLSRVTELNARLEKERLTPIQLTEALCARMWTGPMYVKYQAILRGSGSEYQACLGNGYTTTLHCINSAVVKTSRLTTVTRVYRGVRAGYLPADFWAPNAYGVCGGIEAAFMSTTTDRDRAFEFAAAGGGAELESGKPGVLLEIQQGMVNRGAGMKWCSQYEHEEELLFAPLAGLEVQSTRVEENVLIVSVSLSVNLMSATLDQVISKRKKVVEDMVTHMTGSAVYNVHFANGWEAVRSHHGTEVAVNIVKDALQHS